MIDFKDFKHLRLCVNVYGLKTVDCRPSGTGPVGPAMAGPTFELGGTFFLICKNIVAFFKIKSVCYKKPTSSNRKIATSAFNLRTWDSDTRFGNY